MVVLRLSEDHRIERRLAGSSTLDPLSQTKPRVQCDGCALNHTLPPELAGPGLGRFPLPREKGMEEEMHLGVWTWSQHAST